MATVKLGKHREIELPEDTLERLGVTAGEEFELVEHEKGITLVPRKHIPKGDEWYHTEEWQRMMQEAFDDLKHGRMAGPFEDADDLIKEFNA